MTLEFAIKQNITGPFYVGWSPVSCTLKITDGTAQQQPVTVIMENDSTAQGGQLVFFSQRNQPEASTLSINVEQDGTPASFFIAGQFNRPSSNDKDASIKFMVNGQTVLKIELMVRIRKNANSLSANERDRFLSAFTAFAASGQYSTFLSMHNGEADGEIHGRAAFLPWHRIFVLDLERHLQRIDASVTIPYWDFQNPAPNVFRLEFMGKPSSSLVGELEFSESNPLASWRLENLPLLTRRPRFVTDTRKANVEDQAVTLGRGPGFNRFSLMEIDPHGSAHTSFTGPIRTPSTAPQDPLFFMLHCNIDRLWAQWQTRDLTNNLFNADNLDAYDPQSILHQIIPIDPIVPKIGDFKNDTMWPWNGLWGNGRPPHAPGGQLISSTFTELPGNVPKVFDAIDYQGRLVRESHYADYDTIPDMGSSPSHDSQHFLLQEKKDHLNLINVQVEKSVRSSASFLDSFNKAENLNELTSSLQNLDMLTDKSAIKKATEILTNEKNQAASRVLALSKLLVAVSGSEDLIIYVLDLLMNSSNPADLRKEALETIEIISFSSPIFSTVRARIIDGFRALIRDKDLDIRIAVISYLAKNKDSVVQQALIEGLQDSKKALVPEELAIHLLGYDIKANVFPLLRRIVEESTDNASRTQAIHLLAGDKESTNLLVNLFNSKDEKLDIRKTSLLALKEQNPNEFNRLAQTTILNENENIKLRTLSLNAITHGLPKFSSADEDFVKELKQLSKKTLLPITFVSAVHGYLKNLDTDETK